MKADWVLVSVVCAALLMGSSFAKDSPKYQAGTLIDITHQDSSRVIGNAQAGTVTSVTDREYQITIKVGDMTYVGSYWPRWRWSYEPTDFTVNSEIKVRITKTNMYILRPDGKELRTKIIKRIAEKPSTRN